MRDNYAVGDDRLLMVTSDRLSAFDVVMAEPIPDKGRVLNTLALFWFDRLADIVPEPPDRDRAGERWWRPTRSSRCAGRSMVVRAPAADPGRGGRARLPAGSGYKEYQAQRQRLRHRPAAGPAPGGETRRADLHAGRQGGLGEHDENITFDEMVEH